MGIVYTDGMFLGKEELQRRDLLMNSFTEACSFMFCRNEKGSNFPTSSNGVVLKGLLNPFKLGVKIDSVTVSGVEGLRVCIEDKGRSESLTKTGRLVIGKSTKGDIGLVSDTDFTGKECFVPRSTIAQGKKTYFVVLSPKETFYENALLTVSPQGTGQITLGLARVKDLFRNSTLGRQTKIMTENGNLLTINSFNPVTGEMTFVGPANSFTGEINVQFAIFKTVSPFVEETSNLYTYSTCEVSLVEEFPASTESVLAKVEIENTSSTFNIKTFSLSDPVNELSGNSFLDCVLMPYKQIENVHLADSCVETRNIGANQVTYASLAKDTFGVRDFAQLDSSGKYVIEPGTLFAGSIDVPEYTFLVTNKIYEGKLNDSRRNFSYIYFEPYNTNPPESPSLQINDVVKADKNLGISIFNADFGYTVLQDEYAYFLTYLWITDKRALLIDLKEFNINL